MEIKRKSYVAPDSSDRNELASNFLSDIAEVVVDEAAAETHFDAIVEGLVMLSSPNGVWTSRLGSSNALYLVVKLASGGVITLHQSGEFNLFPHGGKVPSWSGNDPDDWSGSEQTVEMPGNTWNDIAGSVIETAKAYHMETSQLLKNLFTR